MVKIKLKYVVKDVDRHGNVRLYFRRKGHGKVRLAGMPGSDLFMAAYRAALARLPVTVTGITSQEPRLNSLASLCLAYYKSSEFRRLDARTKLVRRRILDELCRQHGTKPADRLEPRHVRGLRDEKADRPHAANALLKALRQVFSCGVAIDLVPRNPAREVPYLSDGSDGFHSWTADEIADFEKQHPVGSTARLALALLLFTGQRRSDVVQFGRQHVRDGWISFTQHKNRNSKPITLQIPIVDELQQIIDATKCGDLTFLITQFGKPFTSNGFGNRFRRWCNEAGLSGCSAHGLRKAAAARLAELGATENEIMAITGHRTSKEVTRYTRAARQKVLAGRAMDRLSAGQKVNRSVPLPQRGHRGGTLLDPK